MEDLPEDLSLKIFRFLDHHNLATAQQVCRKWKVLASENDLWANLFKERWGEGNAVFYAPSDNKSWKDVYIVQDRCDQVGLPCNCDCTRVFKVLERGLKIVKEGDDYYLIHRGEIQRHLGSRSITKESDGSFNLKREFVSEGPVETKDPCTSILDSILFFIGDLEVASSNAKRNRLN